MQKIDEWSRDYEELSNGQFVARDLPWHQKILYLKHLEEKVDMLIDVVQSLEKQIEDPSHNER